MAEGAGTRPAGCPICNDPSIRRRALRNGLTVAASRLRRRQPVLRGAARRRRRTCWDHAYGQRLSLLRHRAVLRPRAERTSVRRRDCASIRATNSCFRPRSAACWCRSRRAHPSRRGCRSRSAYDYSYDGVMRSFEDSLQRLGLARVDIVYLHDVNPRWHGDAYEQRFREAMEGGYPALERLRGEGVVRAIGVGVKDADVCLRFARAGDFDLFMLAGGYTLLEHAAVDANFCRIARRTTSRSSSHRRSIPASSPPAPWKARRSSIRPRRRTSWRARAARSRLRASRCTARRGGAAIRAGPSGGVSAVCGYRSVAEVDDQYAVVDHAHSRGSCGMDAEGPTRLIARRARRRKAGTANERCHGVRWLPAHRRHASACATTADPVGDRAHRALRRGESDAPFAGARSSRRLTAAD